MLQQLMADPAAHQGEQQEMRGQVGTETSQSTTINRVPVMDARAEHSPCYPGLEMRVLTACSLLLAVAAALAAFTVAPIEVSLPPPATTHKITSYLPDKLPAPALNLTGPLQPNSLLLDSAVLLFSDTIFGSESVAVGPGPNCLTMIDRQGYVWIADAQLLSELDVNPTGYRLRAEPQAYIGPGRPLGFKYDGQGNLIVCDSLKGLVMLTPDTRLSVLANRASPSSPLDPGTPIVYANDLDIASDGTIFFSDSQNITTSLNLRGFYDTMQSCMLGKYSGTPSGRLLAYSPSTGLTNVIANDFWYANGVALSADESFVAVVETHSFRVMRVWISGHKAGTVDTLVDGLPAYPDGISRATDGNFWLSLVAPRSKAEHLTQSKLLRSLVAWVPGLAKVFAPPMMGLVVKVSPEGLILQSLWDMAGAKVQSVSSVEEHQGRLWLGNLRGSGVSFIDLN